MTHTFPSNRLEPVSAGRAGLTWPLAHQPLLLLDDAIPQMRHRRRSDDPHSFQLDRLVADVGEQWPTRAQQDVGDVNLHLVYQSSLQVLLTDIGAHQSDVLVTGGGPCL